MILGRGGAQSLRRGSGLADALDGLGLGGAAGPMAVDDDGEGQCLSSSGGQVPGERIGLIEGPGLGPQLAFERRISEARVERSVNAGNGKRVAPCLSPRLSGGIGQQFRMNARSDAIV